MIYGLFVCLTQLNIYGKFWMDMLDSIFLHHQNTNCGNIFWNNGPFWVPETWNTLGYSTPKFVVFFLILSPACMASQSSWMNIKIWDKSQRFHCSLWRNYIVNMKSKGDYRDLCRTLFCMKGDTKDVKKKVHVNVKFWKRFGNDLEITK